MNILFLCKYNRFRSKIAEAYLNSLHIKGIKAKSAGLISGWPIDSELKNVAKDCGLQMKGGPNALTSSLVKWTDIIIIVADNIPLELFAEEKNNNKKEIIQWHIPDPKQGQINRRKKTIKAISKKIDAFLKTRGYT